MVNVTRYDFLVYSSFSSPGQNMSCHSENDRGVEYIDYRGVAYQVTGDVAMRDTFHSTSCHKMTQTEGKK